MSLLLMSPENAPAATPNDISPTFSGQFLVRMAARACTNTIIDSSGHPRRICDDALLALPIFEFNRVRGKARSFLLASEL